MRNWHASCLRDTPTFVRVSTSPASTSTLPPSARREGIWRSSTSSSSTARISMRARHGGRAAAELGLYDELKSIIRARPESVHERGGDGKTALHCAATSAIAELLLDNGADVQARDIDHGSTALQYLIADEAIARLLAARGAEVDIFAAARLGDRSLVERCLRDDAGCAEARVNHAPFAAPGGHIYGWTLGFDLTPADVARKFGHERIAELIVSALSPKARLIDALWCGDGERVRREL